MHSTIRVVCRGCGARINAPSQLLGQVRPCPRCKQRLVIQTKAPDDSWPVLVINETPAPPRSPRAR
jgi:uncharacterized paraquat-inducible protein A